MDKDIRSPTTGVKSPIDRYKEEHCSRCDIEEKCGYIKTELIILCATLRLLELKEKQLYSPKE